MKKSQASGYDCIAPFYDDMVGLVFGKEIFDAQIYYLNEVHENTHVLILGGGTGWILPALFKHSPNIKIEFIDSSEKMIEIARKHTHLGEVNFICGTEEDIPSNMSFDVIITNFYVDGFSSVDLPNKIKQIESFLKPSGKWLVTDFVDTKRKRHQFILWYMHVFFSILIHHPNKKLVNWEETFNKANLTKKAETTFRNGFIKAALYTLKW